MHRLRLAESAILPWVVLSQTVPLIAIAPLVRRWGSQIEIGGFDWESEYSVAVIAAYLAFFPVAVGMLRGLKSPDATHLDLMRTYGDRLVAHACSGCGCRPACRTCCRRCGWPPRAR